MQASEYESMMATHTNPPMAGEALPRLAGLGAHHRSLGNTRLAAGGLASIIAASLIYDLYKEESSAGRYLRLVAAMTGGFLVSRAMR